MKTKTSSTVGLALTCVLLSQSPVLAQTIGERSVSAGLSTFGLNLEGTYRFDPNFRARGALMGLPGYDELSDTFEEDGTTYAYDATVASFAALIDYYPSETGFRVSGGLMFNQTDASATAELSGQNTFTLDDGTEFSTGTANLEIEFEKTVSPMVSAGYDYNFGQDWVLSGEVGAIFTGGVSLDATSTNAQLQAEIDEDSDIQELRDDLDDVSFLPYLSVTVGYRF